MSAVQALLLAVCCCSPLVQSVIHNREAADDIVEPVAVEISPDEHLGSVAERVLGSDFSAARRKRQAANGTDFGVTVRLNGTNRHFFALVHWTGHPSEVLFIVTMTRRNNPTDSCLWRSTDYGRTFRNDSDKFNDSSAVISWYYVSPFDQYIVMADTRQGKIFVTRDEGDSFTGRQLEFTPNKIQFQGRTIPKSSEGTLPEHMMGYEAATQSLYVSKDLGDTWVYLGGNISRYSWRVLDEEFESNTSLYFESNINNTHALLMTSQDPYSDTDTVELDPGLGPIKINSTVFNHEYILVQRLQETNPVPLWVSVYRRPFRQTVFLLDEPLQHAHYAVMDASEHRVFLAVEHANTTDVHLYVSDVDGVNYTLSLDHVVATEDWGSDNNPSFDIHVVAGMDGVYMVNVYDGDNIQTRISYNKGAHWRSLTAPPVDSEGQPILCQPPLCSLHLRMDTDSVLGYSSIFSRTSAVGLILAQGNTGEGLNSDRSQLGVYISRDGGFSWSQIQRGHWTFQMVALGSVIVMAPKRTTVDPLDYVLWSCDEGVTWTRYTFTTTPMRLIGILAQKGEKARRLTLFGYLRGVSPFAWLIVDLDFSVAVPDQCSYPDDYFEWVPSDGREDRRCVLGAEKTYERRNSTACCYVDPDFVRAIENVSCPCSREDYECEVGYRLESPGGRCVDGFPPPPDSCTEGGYYLRPSGYRKIVGNTCTDKLGSQYLIQHVPCPVVAPAGLGVATEGGSNSQFFTNQNITFVLTQKLGWVNSTVYTWKFGDGTTVSGKGLGDVGVQTYRYATAGRYTVSVMANNTAGRATISLNIAVGGPPAIKSLVVAGNTTEAGNSLTFTLTSDMVFGTYYEWDFGDGTTVTSQEHQTVEMQSHTYTSRGVYTVRVTAYNIYGLGSTSTQVFIGAPRDLSVFINGDQRAAGNNITFTLMVGEGSVTTYEWDFGDGTPTLNGSQYMAVTHAYQQSGLYTLRATATNPLGSESTSVDIYIGAPEIERVEVGGDYSEPGNDITFTLTIREGYATMYKWDFGDGRTANSSEHHTVEVVTHSYSEHGVYTVLVTASNPIGKSSMSVVVHIGAPRDLSVLINGDQRAAGNDITFTLIVREGSVTTYEWDFGDGTPILNGSQYMAVTHAYQQSGLYTLRATATNPLGSESTSVDIYIGAPEIERVEVGGDYSEPGNDITFTLTIREGYATMYEWDFGDGRTASSSEHHTVEVVTHSYSEHGVYTVLVTASNPIGKSSMSVVVHIGDVLANGLNLTVQGDQSKAGQELTFMLTQEKGLTEETVYTWNFGDKTPLVHKKGLEAAARQTHTYASEGDYTVRVTASNEGGMNSISLDLTIGTTRTPAPPTPEKLTGTDDEEGNKTGLGVSVALLILLIILVVGAFVIVLFWYRKRYLNLQGQYKTLQEGTGGDPMALSISASELQEDFGYSKDSEADDKALVSGDGEL